MPKQHQNKFGWQSALGAIAISLSTFGIRSSPVQAAPKPIKDSFKLAQVGVRSRINPPTPLNLRPRTHIPLPTHSRSQDYYGYPGYRDSYRGSHGGSYRNDRYGSGHDHHHHHHHHHHRGNRRNRGPVIIINPATSSSYSNYSNQSGYIRVIRK